MNDFSNPTNARERLPYRLERLPTVPPFFREARMHSPLVGDLVYYGPLPTCYGIGEVLEITDRFVVVDFRGTGLFGVHQEILEPQYILPISDERRAVL